MNESLVSVPSGFAEVVNGSHGNAVVVGVTVCTLAITAAVCYCASQGYSVSFEKDSFKMALESPKTSK